MSLSAQEKCVWVNIYFSKTQVSMKYDKIKINTIICHGRRKLDI